MHKTADTVEMR